MLRIFRRIRPWPVYDRFSGVDASPIQSVNLKRAADKIRSGNVARSLPCVEDN